SRRRRAGSPRARFVLCSTSDQPKCGVPPALLPFREGAALCRGLLSAAIAKGSETDRTKRLALSLRRSQRNRIQYLEVPIVRTDLQNLLYPIAVTLHNQRRNNFATARSS